MTLHELLQKTCLIGLTYLDSQGNVLKTAQYAGTVVQVDEQEGITVELFALGEDTPKAQFHLPPGLEAWFIAPKGHYRDVQSGIDIRDPDYFVTWDIVRKRDDMADGQQQWWEWHPRTAAPSVN